MINGTQTKQSCPVCGSNAVDLPYISRAAFSCPSCGTSLRVHRSKGVAITGFIILFLLTRIASDVPLGWGIFAIAAVAILAWEYVSRSLVVAAKS